MAALREDPIVTAGPWALAPTIALGVVGGRRLTDRVGRSVPAARVGPRSDMGDVVRSVDALLVELSVFDDPSSAWAFALRPIGFDRGQALARLLSAASATGRPVLTIDDRGAGRTDPWTDHLLARVDDVAVLGPLLPGGVSWNPGCHLDPGALVLAGRPHDRAVLPLDGTAAGWRVAQRAAAGSPGRAATVADPWTMHAAAELDELHRCSAEVGPPRPSDLPSPAEAVTALCERLGLPAPSRPAPVVLLGHEPDEFERAELEAGVPGASVQGPGAVLGEEQTVGGVTPVVLSDSDRPVDVIAIAGALAIAERFAHEVPVAVRGRGVAVGTYDQLVHVGADRAEHHARLADAAVIAGAP